MLAIWPWRPKVVFARAVGLDGLDLEGGAVVLQAATGEQLVEPFEPAEPAPVRQVDERRDGPARPRPANPSPGGPPVSPLPEAHPPRRDDRERERPRCRPGSGPRRRAGRRGASAWSPTTASRRALPRSVGVDREGLDPEVARDVGQREGGHAVLPLMGRSGTKGGRSGDRSQHTSPSKPGPAAGPPHLSRPLPGRSTLARVVQRRIR